MARGFSPQSMVLWWTSSSTAVPSKPSRRVPPTGAKCLRTWSYRGHVPFKPPQPLTFTNGKKYLYLGELRQSEASTPSPIANVVIYSTKWSIVSMVTFIGMKNITMVTSTSCSIFSKHSSGCLKAYASFRWQMRTEIAKHFPFQIVDIIYILKGPVKI